MRKTFTGCGTALVTPFRQNDAIDEAALRRSINRQIDAGIDFLVPCGTTGESPTLSHTEHRRVAEIVCEHAGGRIPIVIGTGSNSTREAVDLTRHAACIGADGCLVVAPYYNKPTQDGLYRHFMAIADVGLPIVVYNIPGRTGVNITPETMTRITKHPCVVALKEATGSLEQMTQDILLCDKRITYFSGDDALTLPLMSIGGHGTISVVANVVPHLVATLVHAAQDGRWDEARDMHLRLFPLCRTMFKETNPIPIKAAMALLNMIEPVWRLPLTAPSRTTLDEIRLELKAIQLPAQRTG